jgi:uncharacterized protein YprB with RNaseH-like and TPR domain
MLSARLRERLSRLARGLASDPTPDGDDADTLTPSADGPPAAAFSAPTARPWFLHYDPASSGKPLAGPNGTFLEVEPDLASLLEDHGTRVEAWLSLAAEAWGAAEGRLYVDIETAGLSAAPLFLIGTLTLEGRRLRLRQFLARDYTEEAPLLQHFFPWSTGYERLITFNGQTFDLPYLLDRAIYHRLAAGLAQAHTDLLPLARRQWRDQTPNCRLSTLETYLCGHQRVGDVDGGDIPNLYHQFVRTPNWDVLAPVLHHNALDLLTMAELAGLLDDGSKKW